MRVLFLSKTPAGASSFLNHSYPGCGWIASLEEHLKKDKDIELGVCFFHNKAGMFKFKEAGVTYYPVGFKFSSILGKIKSRISYDLTDNNTEDVLKVIDDFKPDLIQLFGTESGMGEVIAHTDIKTIVHIQGMLNPVLASWFPKGISQTQVLFNSPVKDILFRTGLYHEYYTFRKRAKREELILKNAKYFFGRTHWDSEVLGIMNDDFDYFHCDEILRPVFYGTKWISNPGAELELVSVMNPSMYKGLDIILEAACLLKKHGNLSFKWHVYGMNAGNNVVRLFEKVRKEKFLNNNVYIEGSKTAEELLAHLLKANIFIHPSHIDNSPNSVCEAMILGLPVIATNVGGISSIIENENNGLLYNSQDPYELVALIKRLAKDTFLVKKISRNARETALARHNIPAIISTIKKAYGFMLNNLHELPSLVQSGVTERSGR